jgi:NAD(P)-dependent dehydrogenase (short-subunit alcohol dehydrogenase family)
MSFTMSASGPSVSNPPLTSAICSYNFGRSDNSEQALEQMATQGVSFFTASGDYGDIGDPQSNLDMPTQTLPAAAHTRRLPFLAPGMQERGYGRIVNIASNAAIGTALPAATFYAATKAEVLILTRRFAMELGRRGITVNAVAPGWIVTEMASTATRSSKRAFGI